METGSPLRADVELSTHGHRAAARRARSSASRTSTAPTPAEAEIRGLADSLYARVDWTLGCSARPPLVAWAGPRRTASSTYDWRGYNEAMILYVLALGSPTHPVEPGGVGRLDQQLPLGHVATGRSTSASRRCSATSTRTSGSTSAASRTPTCAARGIDYFENSRRATLAQRAYAIANPGGWAGYGEDVWGLTACDGPVDAERLSTAAAGRFRTYAARGASFTEVRRRRHDRPDGGRRRRSPFAPEIVIPALMAMRERYGEHLYSTLRLRRRASTRRSPSPMPVAARAGRARRRLVRHRLPRHRPGPDPGDDRELPQRPRLEADAQEPARRAAASGAPASPAAGWQACRSEPGRRGSLPPGSRSRPIALALGALVRRGARARRRRASHPALLGDGPRGRGRAGAGAATSSASNPGVRVERPADPLVGGAREAAHRVRRRLDARRGAARQHLDPRVRRRSSAIEPLDAARRRRRALRPPRRLLPRHLGHQRHRRRGCTACPGTSTRASSSTAATCSRAPATTRTPRHAGRSGARRMAARQGAPGRRALRDPPADQRVGAAGGPRRCRPARRCSRTATRAARSATPAFRRGVRRSTSRSSASASRRRSATQQIANLYQEFARGYFAMYITGPWNLGEFRRRLPRRAAGRVGDGAAARRPTGRTARASRSPAARAW